MSPPKVLVAGVGNIFLGDDAFGPKVLDALEAEAFPENVRRADFGIRGFDLALELTRGYDLVIIVDAARGGGPPGTLYTIDPCSDMASIGEATHEPHGLVPARVVELARRLGAGWREMRVVGCEPETFEPDPSGMLSSAVDGAVGPAARLVRDLVDRFLLAGTCHA